MQDCELLKKDYCCQLKSSLLTKLHACGRVKTTREIQCVLVLNVIFPLWCGFTFSVSFPFPLAHPQNPALAFVCFIKSTLCFIVGEHGQYKDLGQGHTVYTKPTHSVSGQIRLVWESPVVSLKVWKLDPTFRAFKISPALQWLLFSLLDGRALDQNKKQLLELQGFSECQTWMGNRISSLQCLFSILHRTWLGGWGDTRQK